MRGSVGLNAPSYLPALVSSHSQGNSLLASLTGQTGRAPMPAPRRRRPTALPPSPSAKLDFPHFRRRGTESPRIDLASEAEFPRLRYRAGTRTNPVASTIPA